MLDSKIRDRLRLPVIAAPMLRISGPDLVVAACRNGVVGSFPTANARSVDELDSWLRDIATRTQEGGGVYAPWCPNLIIRQPRMQDDLACLVRNKVEMVITSVGSPAAAVAPLHDIGALVLADVATVKHAEKALQAGADGLVLLTAGAGGQTGWMNGFAFVRAVRAMFDGPIVLAGGVSDGATLLAAEALGCDLAYMGTRFIATPESMADDAYRQMLVDASMDDVVLTKAFTGLQTNMLRSSILAAGLDPDRLDEQVTAQSAKEMFGGGSQAPGPKRWVDIRSAGHSVSGVGKVQPVAELIADVVAQYDDAKAAMRRRLQA